MGSYKQVILKKQYKNISQLRDKEAVQGFPPMLKPNEINVNWQSAFYQPGFAHCYKASNYLNGSLQTPFFLHCLLYMYIGRFRLWRSCFLSEQILRSRYKATTCLICQLKFLIIDYLITFCYLCHLIAVTYKHFLFLSTKSVHFK